MGYGDIDAALRRLLGEALVPIEEKLGKIEKQLGETTQSAVEYLSTKEVAAAAGVAQGTVRRWIREGKLRSCQAGRSVRVKRSDLENFMCRGVPDVEGLIDFKARAAELLGDD
jgi:excisionase family DNA binding protein